MTRRSHPSGSRAGSLWPRFRFVGCAVLVGGLVSGCGTNAIEGIDPTGGASSGGGFADAGVGTIRDGGFVPIDPGACGSDAGGGVIGGFMSNANPDFGGLGTAADPPPPISGGTLIVLRNGTAAVAADADRDRIYVVDLVGASGPLPSLTLRASIPLAIHDEPGRLVEDGAGLVHVILRKAGAVATIDPTTARVVLRRSVCALPRGLAYDGTADALYVACGGGELLTLKPLDPTPLRSLRLQQDLRDVVVDGPRLMVSRFRSAEVMVLDAAGTMLQSIRPASFTNLSVHAGRSFSPAVAWRTVAMPGGGAMMVHQRGLNGKVGTTSGGYGGMNPCDTIVHTSVTRMKSGERPVAGPALPGFALPVDIAVSADGNRVAMIAAGNGQSRGSALRKFFLTNVDDVASEWEFGCGTDDRHGPSPSPTCVGDTTNAGCPMDTQNCFGVCIDATLICESPMMRSTVDASAAPMSADGGVTATGDGGVFIGDGGISADGGVRTHCKPELPGSAEPVAVAFAGPTEVLVQTREPAQLWLLSDVTGVATPVDLSQESRADTGHAVFHSNSGSGLACASCHPEGHEDGRVWDFQCSGPRRTQDVSGGLIGTEPFHWEGDLPDFSHLVQTVFVGRMSGPSLTRDQEIAALNWLNAVPAKPALRAATDPQVQRGKELFNSPTLACFSCHAGPAFTNNATVDVGTSAAFQVPSLRGVGWRAPYLHDGCAPTLAARFSNQFCAGGDAHGSTSKLTPPQIDDLVAFLESL